ncbi:hypothetical protein BGX24_007541 [Mortierella sp. AD032]|nr:hypothetical protein BGX24_007541 [Mortierella sp. AD032]
MIQEDLVRFLSSVGMTLKSFYFSSMGDCLVDLYASSIATGNNHIQGTTTTTTVATTIEAEEEEGSGQRLQGIRFLEKQRTSITDLTLRLLNTNDKTIAHLLGKTPHLTRFEINQLALSTGDFLASLPVLCPDIKILKLTNCPMIPSSAYMCLFQHRCGLQLEQLLVYAITLDDPTLRLIASTQGDTLQELTIWGSSKVTDVGFKALLAGCHRLTYLAPNYNLAVSLSIMADDNENDEDGDGDDRDGMTADTERRRNHKKPTIASSADYAEPRSVPTDSTTDSTTDSFVACVGSFVDKCSWSDDELIKGFLGVEHQERQEAEGMRSNADHSGNELANEICEETTTTMKTTATNSLKVFETTKVTVKESTDMVERFRKAGVQVRTPDE